MDFEGLLILIAALVGLAILLAPIGVFVLSKKVRALTDRIAKLENAQGRAADSPAAVNSETAYAETPWVAPEKQRQRLAEDAVDPAMITATLPKVSKDAVEAEDVQVPRAFVFRTETLQNAINWIKENWFLGIAAVSLALAGIFMVQYGVEQGLLTPFARIMGALALGAAFIIGGEFTRRRFGDEGGTMNALPSTFSGAGIVTLFAAVLSARHLYDMLPSDLALYGLIAVAALAIVLGWFYGPFLAAVGIIGALGAPFVVGGSSDAPHLFYYYFALIMIMALAIDTVRRWAWISVLALVGGFAATWTLLAGGADAVHALVFGVITVIAASAIAQRRIWPNQDGAMLSDVALKLFRKEGFVGWPEFPARLAGGTFVAAMVLSTQIAIISSDPLVTWLGVCSIAALGLLALIWMSRAPALQDLSAIAPLVLLFLIILLSADYQPIYKDFISITAVDRIEGEALPKAASVFAALFALFAALGFWRASQGVRGSLIWIGASALAVPAALGALEIMWVPSDYIGAYPWAGHAILGAALMTLLAERAAKRWQGDMRPAALFAMSALSLISFALMLILSTAALSVAIAVMIVIAAMIDRRLDMPWLGLFIQLCIAVLGWRFLIDPGVPWASWQYTPLWDVVLGYAAPLGLMAFAWWTLRPIKRIGAQLALESAIWSLGAVFALILLERALRSDIDSFWGLSLAGSILLISMGAQLYRWRADGRFKLVRVLLAALMGLLGFGAIGIALTVLSPLTYWGARDVYGPLLLDTIAIAYLVPAAVLAVLVWKLDHIARILRIGFAALSSMMVAGYIALEIRRFWQSGEIASSSVSQGELYSYTIAMLLASVGLLLFAFTRRSDILRKLAMAGIALTIAKVFLIDMGGLNGLVRVASFLGLGLALSGLAWLNRAMSARWDKNGAQDEPQPALDPDT